MPVIRVTASAKPLPRAHLRESRGQDADVRLSRLLSSRLPEPESPTLARLAHLTETGPAVLRAGHRRTKYLAKQGYAALDTGTEYHPGLPVIRVGVYGDGSGSEGDHE